VDTYHEPKPTSGNIMCNICRYSYVLPNQTSHRQLHMAVWRVSLQCMSMDWASHVMCRYICPAMCWKSTPNGRGVLIRFLVFLLHYSQGMSLFANSNQRVLRFGLCSWRWMVRFTPLPLYSRERAPEPVWTTWRRENSWPYRSSNSDLSVVQPVGSRYTNYAIPAPLLNLFVTVNCSINVRGLAVPWRKR
jgi:hypothetical protein